MNEWIRMSRYWCECSVTPERLFVLCCTISTSLSPSLLLGDFGTFAFGCSKKAFITLCSPVVPLLSTSKADSGLASEFRRDRAIYTAYERMLKYEGRSQPHQSIATLSNYWINSCRAQFDSSSLITLAILISYCSNFQAWEFLYARRWSSGQIMRIQRGEKVIETLFFPLTNMNFPIGIKLFKTFC